MKRLIQWVVSIMLALLPLVVAIPAYAISNPGSITFGTNAVQMYMVFQNVLATGDVLFMAETDIHYGTAPTDYTAGEAFLFEVLDTDGTTVLFSTPISAYQNKVTGIYVSPSLATSLTYEAAYGVRLTGNPAIFPTLTEGTNKITRTLQPQDYITGTQAVNRAALQAFGQNIVDDLEAHDSVSTYQSTVLGVKYLTPTGASIFVAGIPGLQSYCPDLFMTTAQYLVVAPPPQTGAGAAEANPTSRLGLTMAGSVNNMGTWLHISSAMAGGLLALIFMMFFGYYIYQKTQSVPVVMVAGSIVPIAFIYLGLIPMGVAFIIILFLAAMTGWYFLSRGSI